MLFSALIRCAGAQERANGDFYVELISLILKLNAERRDFERDQKIFPINVITIPPRNGNDLHMKVWSDQ